MRKFIKFLRKLKRMILFLRKCYIDGGVTSVNIAQVNYGGILKDKKILITGGSSGIGFAIAKKAISEGAKVVITGRVQEKLERAKLEINSQNLEIIQWDASDVSIRHEKLEQVEGILNGSIDILVNNAGILLDQNFFTVKEDIWDSTYEVNSKSVYFLCQAVSNKWIKNKHKGKIINLSSTSGFYGASIPYGMTKWDIAGLTEGLGKKLSEKGIIVNGIAPGRTATAMLKKEDSNNLYDYKTSAKRYGLPEEIAELATFLMSDASNFIVGQTIVCDGGYILKV
ncbi:SDR family NAD(P)-dependent oxidoreductase [Vibrio fluvialis]|uniref:SDR family NAD(P)-dependent oxidoreductase n=1 Tax=Vibrio fluvialis TaxID=676 RepID=UPI001F1C7846|nr:SDR family oxidoreductase [Vibrio fluvialis]MCE7650697.1 SDR family oxidoreductase [Vibrio fluvialis]